MNNSNVDDAIAEEIGNHIIHIKGRSLRIEGWWDDSNWTIIMDKEDYPYTSSANAVWKSGQVRNGVYADAAKYFLNVPSTGYTERSLCHESSKLLWYGIEFSIYIPNPLGTLHASTACRLILTNTNAASIINAEFQSNDKGGYFKSATHDVAEFTLNLKGAIYLRPIPGLVFTSFILTGDADESPDNARIYFNDGVSSGSGGPLPIAGFQPNIASAGVIRIRNGNHFAPTGGVVRTTSLPDCVLDVTKLRLQGDQQTVSINTNLEIKVDGITTKAGVNVGVYNSNKSHNFNISALTNSEGIFTGETIGDWTGYIFDTATDSDWRYPTSANRVDRRSKKIILRRFDLIEQITSPSIGATGKYETLIFMQQDDKVTGTKTQAAAITGITINKTTEAITISEDVTTQDIYNYYKQWLALDAQLNEDDFIIIDGKTLDLGSWNLIVNSGKTLAGTDDINKINTTGDVTANGTIDVPYVDSSGVVIVLICNQANAKIFYQIDPDDGSTDTERYVEADNNGKYSITGVPKLSHIYVVAKKDGYDYYKTDFDPDKTVEVQLPLGALDAIDTTISLSGYIFDPGNTSNDNNILFSYQTSGKSFIVMGETDLAPSTGRQGLSRRVFDHVWGLNSGMKFLNYWNRSGSITKLDGKPYKITRGKININTTKIDFSRLSGMTESEASYFGEYVADEDNNVYRAPFSNHALIDFSDPTDVVESTPEAKRLFAVAFREEMDSNSTKLSTIDTEVGTIKTKTDNLPDNTSAKLNSMDTQIVTVDEVVDAIKEKTDDIIISDGKVKADTEDQFVNVNSEHILIVSGSQERIYGFDKNLNRNSGLDFTVHSATIDLKAVRYFNNRYYVMDRVSTTILRFYEYRLSGKIESQFDIAVTSSQLMEDFDIDVEGGVEIIRILVDATVNKLLAYNLQTKAEITSKHITLSGVENPTAVDIRLGFAYVADERSPPQTPRVVPVDLSNGSITTTHIINTSEVAQPIAIIAGIDNIIVVDADDNEAHYYEYDGSHLKMKQIPTTITDIEGMTYFKALPLDTQQIHEAVDDIKAQTDKLGFNTDDDVKVTLDGEEVTTDSASRTASKADVTGIGTPDISTLATKTTVDAIKIITDKLHFEGDNVQSVEQNPTNILAEHILVSDNEDDKVYALDEDNARIPKLDFALHGDHQHAIGFAEFEGNLYGLDADRADEVDVFIYSRTGKDIAKITLAVPTQGAQDISVGRDPDGQVVIRIINDGTVNKLIAFDRDTLAEIPAKTLALSDVEAPLAYYEYEGLAYIIDVRSNINDTPRVRVVKQSDGTLVTAKSFNLPTTFKEATAIIVTRHYIKIINQPTRLLGVFKHDGNSVKNITLPVEIADASGMVWITSPIQDIIKINEDTSNILDKTENLPDDTSATLLDLKQRFGIVHDHIDDLETNTIEIDAVVDAIKLKTDKLNFNSNDDVKSTLDGEAVTVDVSSIETKVDSVKAKTDNLPDNTTTKLSEIKTDTTAIKVKTDNLPANTETKLTEIKTETNQIDTNVTAIKVKTDKIGFNSANDIKATLDGEAITTTVDISTLETKVDAVKTKTDNLPTDTNTTLSSITTKVDSIHTRVDEFATPINKLSFDSSNKVEATLQDEEVNIGKVKGTAVANINDFKTAIDYNAFWKVLTSAITTNNSFGKLIKDNINASISSRLPTTSYVAPDNTKIGNINTRLTATRASNLDNLDATISGLEARIEAGLLNDADGRAFLDAIKQKVGEQLVADNLSASLIASAVWNSVVTGFTTNSSFGKLVKERLPEIATILTNVNAVKSKTDNLPANTATEISSIKSKVNTVHDHVDDVEAKTNQLVFHNNKIEATLRDEEVDIGSVKGTSVTGISDFRETTSVTDLTTKVNAVKAKTDKLMFNNDSDVKSTLDGEPITSTVDISSIETKVDSIKIKTDKLGFNTDDDVKATLDGESITSTIDVSNIEGKIDNIKTKTDELPDDTEAKLSEIKTVVDTISTNADTIKSKTDKLGFNSASDVKSTLDGEVANVDLSAIATQTSVDGIKAKTDNLPDNTTTELSDMEGKIDIVDTVVDSVKVKTDNLPTNTSDKIAEIKTKSDEIDTTVDAIKTKTDNLPSNTSDKLSEIKTVSDGIKSKTDNIVISNGKVEADIGDAETNIGKVKGVEVTGITDFAVTASNIAVAIEQALLNDSDGRQYLLQVKNKVIEALADDDISPSIIAHAVWNILETDVTKADSFGLAIKTIKSTLSTVSDDVEFIKKVESSEILITNDTIEFIYGGTTLLSFTRKTATTESDWSGGRQ